MIQNRQLLFWLFLILGFQLEAQQYSFENYSVSQGLPQSQVYTMSEDGRGFLWLGTNGGGLARFDGQRFESFSTRQGLSDNHINSLLEDSKGNIWIATRNGLDRFDGRQIHHVDLPVEGKVTITSLIEDPHQVVWVASNRGVFQFDGKNWRIHKELKEQAVNLLFQDSKGAIWLGLQRGLKCKQQSQWLDAATFGTLNRAQITGFAEDSLGQIWISTYNSGLFRYNGYGTRRVLVEHQELIGAIYFDLLFDREGMLWLATQNKGVARWNGQDSLLTLLSKDDGLANDHVRCMLEDRWGILWFGTSGGGLSKYAGQQFVRYGPKQGVFEQAYAVLEDHDCNLWIGNAKRGLTCISSDSIRFWNRRNDFFDVKSKTLFQDSKYQMWAGTDGKGLFRLDEDTILRITATEGLGSNWIKDISEGKNDKLYIATAGAGICRLSPVDTSKYLYRFLQYRNHLPIPERIEAIHIDKWDRIWFASRYKGLGYIRSDSILKFIDLGGGSGLQTIQALIEDDSGNLWLGTEGAGVVRLEIYAQSDTFPRKIFTENLTIGPNYFLHLDELGYLWIGNNKGVDRATLDENNEIIEVKHFGQSEGFLGTETCQNAVTADREGNLYFGTINGLMRFNLGQGLRNTISPIVSIRDVNLFYESLAVTRFKAWYDADQGLKTGLLLPHDQNHLGFDFIGVNHPNPAQVKYQWRLLGAEQRWSPVSSKTSATYSNLNPGSYRFQLRAVNEDGVWSEIMSTSQFEIAFPFWQEWWFILSLIALISTLIFLFVRYRLNQVRNKAKIEQQRLELENAMLELEQKALRLQMNPHFIFNALNSIQGLIATKDTQKSRYYLAKFSKLMRRVLENSREANISLEREVEGLQVYMDLEQFCGGGRFAYKIELDDDLSPDETLIPPMMIQPFLENAIIHGINHLEDRKGLIHLSFDKRGETLVCKIKDNGIGREKAQQVNKHRVPGHKSTALLVTKERLKVLENTHGPDSAGLMITDLYDEKQIPQGTEVIIKIPLIEDW